MEELFERLEEVGFAPNRQGNRPEIGRAIGNLMAAVRTAFPATAGTKTLTHEVIDILDEAAQRIERLKSPSDQ